MFARCKTHRPGLFIAPGAGGRGEDSFQRKQNTWQQHKGRNKYKPRAEQEQLPIRHAGRPADSDTFSLRRNDGIFFVAAAKGFYDSFNRTDLSEETFRSMSQP